MTNIVLASLSRTRQDMMNAAGIKFHALPPQLDEDALKDELLSEGSIHPRELALRLAEAKALSLTQAKDAIVIGADQTLSCDDVLFNKASDETELKERLERLKGKTHHLHAAVVCAKNGEIVFSHLEDASLTMRNFSDSFLASYLQNSGRSALSSVGGYQLENAGIQLFEKIEGNYFAILGLPLLPLLAFLREQGELEA